MELVAEKCSRPPESVTHLVKQFVMVPNECRSAKNWGYAHMLSDILFGKRQKEALPSPSLIRIHRFCVIPTLCYTRNICRD